ncbi:UPF0187 protein At3g61320, chloroplastic-like isoform X2 [Selaginella moellendorffii]|uniref:UPF0187 protein At3g61320, chloroplastic-like isoform X2 n=1 Tax=Selaginella moellendorffii TaxID=88036 RepID=UPI000D1C69BA|nr:UPF0187 protein At3g61320, chloroplastic-like isoform X2 [Selaginella moellendorffii]|eukprot:XP_024527733.1 UPF0187 protein At3g61320, chloroplastic-like isoform X2 [Selaginella moellendorffii]
MLGRSRCVLSRRLQSSTSALFLHESGTESLRPGLQSRSREGSSVSREDWIRHRSSRRHPRDRLVASNRQRSSAISAYNQAVISGIFSYSSLLHISPIPFQLTAPALALLLVFRTNSSYSRYNEGRKAFGSNVNRALGSTIGQRNGQWWSMPRFHCFHIDTDKALQEELKGVLDGEDLAFVLAATHRPILVLLRIAETTGACQGMSAHNKAIMDLNITQLHDNLGACARILRTPIPPSYSHLTSRMLIIWHLTLALALWDFYHWLTIPATGFSATALFCIDEVGVIIEEPFSILPLGSICELVQKNVAEMIEAHEECDARNGHSA